MAQRASVCVVIPAYNAESSLRETLESVFAQTREPDEIIVVDDGSTDGTAAVVRSYGDRIRYIYQENQGLPGARNTGVHHTNCDWVAFFDSDDLMLPQKLERQMAVAEMNPSLCLIYSSFDIFYTDGTRRNIAAFPADKLWPALRYRSPILPSTSMIRRSTLLELDGFRNVYGAEDWDFWFRLVRRYSTSVIKEIPETLVLYRVWEFNLTKKFVEVNRSMLQLVDELLLSGLTGLKRSIWKRRIEARLFYELSVELRGARNERYWEYAIESLLRWPFWGKIVTYKRYKVFAHMMLTRLRNPRANLHYWWPQRQCRAGRSLSVN